MPAAIAAAAANHDSSHHLLVSPRGDRTGEALKLDVTLQVAISPVMVMLRDQCLRRGPVGFLHLADLSNVKTQEPAVFVEPERYLNSLRDDGHRISKADAQTLQGAFCDARGYKNLTLFFQRMIAIFHGPRRARAEKVFEILAENSQALAGAAGHSPGGRFGAAAAVPLTRRTVTLARVAGKASTSWDNCIPFEKRNYSLLTFLGLMAGVSVAIENDDAFDSVLRSFEVVAPEHSSSYYSAASYSAASNINANNTAAFLDNAPAEQTHPKSIPRRVREEEAKKKACASNTRYIAGFMGHIAGGVSERFGETHYATMAHLPDIKKHHDASSTAAAKPVMEIKYRGGNKSNFHNFTLS